MIESADQTMGHKQQPAAHGIVMKIHAIGLMASTYMDVDETKKKKKGKTMKGELSDGIEKYL